MSCQIICAGAVICHAKYHQIYERVLFWEEKKTQLRITWLQCLSCLDGDRVQNFTLTLLFCSDTVCNMWPWIVIFSWGAAGRLRQLFTSCVNMYSALKDQQLLSPSHHEEPAKNCSFLQCMQSMQCIITFPLFPCLTAYILTTLFACLCLSYKNREQMTFDDVGSEPDQEFEMQPDRTGVLEYSTKWVTHEGSSSPLLSQPSFFLLGLGKFFPQL